MNIFYYMIVRGGGRKNLPAKWDSDALNDLQLQQILLELEHRFRETLIPIWKYRKNKVVEH